ncbi:restriction endonuclease subunit S [Kluyvera cryocrescens]|uniref:restriction endonuclease subunit S n=1 Tax=Kluyvera cryocrescens TaxID=580 RepID=UPI003D7FFE9D
MNDTLEMQAEKIIPKGYKLTEAGVIPEDWDVRKIGDIAEVIRGASPRPKGDKRFYGGNIPRLMVEDVTRDGKYVTPSVDSLTEAGAKLSRPCDKGTLTLVCSGTVGIPSILAVNACIHDGFLGLTKVKKSVSIDYLYHFFTTQQEKFNNSATHGGVFTNLTTDGVKEFLLALPRNKNEQIAIANFLSDTDTFITELEQLIIKKQSIKTATMQQLLTGRTRLPQFAKYPDGTSKSYKASELGAIPEDWKVLSVGQVCDLLTGFPFSSSKYSDSGIRLLRGSNVKRGITDWSDGITQYWPEISADIKQYELYAGDIVISMDGSLVGRSFAQLSDSDLPAVLLQRVARVRTSFVDQGFLKEWICSQFFTEHCDAVKTVTAIPHISPQDIRSFKFLMPPTNEEQTAIANILSDMDAELTALEQKLAKVRDIKQGMMQQLLTGRIRLPLEQQL